MTEQQLAENHERWENRFTTLWRTLILVGVFTIAVTAGFVVVTLAEVQRLSETNNRLNRQTILISERLVDCTTPGHPCYDDGQKRTGAVVLNLNAVTKAAVLCADRPGVITQTEMESCINQQLGR